jgi:hypothetical protein
MLVDLLAEPRAGETHELGRRSGCRIGPGVTEQVDRPLPQLLDEKAEDPEPSKSEYRLVRVPR